MKCFVYIVSVLLISKSALGQKPNSMIEVNPYVRMDWYPEFSYILNGRASTDYIKMKGISWGIEVSYGLPLNNKKILLKTGLGYYRYSFNKMDNHNTTFGKNKARYINYPSMLDVLYTANKYWYNNVSANIAIEKLFNLNKSTQITGGINVNNYFTFSQYYRVTANYPTGPPKHKYTTRNNCYFGLSANINAELLKKMGKIAMGPSITLPMFDLWKQDEVFWEKNSDSRNKWLRGIGFGICINYYLMKNY